MAIPERAMVLRVLMLLTCVAAGAATESAPPPSALKSAPPTPQQPAEAPQDSALTSHNSAPYSAPTQNSAEAPQNSALSQHAAEAPQNSAPSQESALTSQHTAPTQNSEAAPQDLVLSQNSEPAAQGSALTQDPAPAAQDSAPTQQSAAPQDSALSQDPAPQSAPTPASAPKEESSAEPGVGKFFLSSYSTRTWTFLFSFISTVPYTCYTTGGGGAPAVCMGRRLRRSRKILSDLDSGALDPTSLSSSGSEDMDQIDTEERKAEHKFFFSLYRTVSSTATVTVFATNRSLTVSASVMCTYAGFSYNIC